MNKRQFIRILSQRSTAVGIAGVIGGVMAIADIPISAGQELQIVEGLLLFVSLVAIITKEEEPYNGTDRRSGINSGSSGGSGVGAKGQASNVKAKDKTA